MKISCVYMCSPYFGTSLMYFNVVPGEVQGKVHITCTKVPSSRTDVEHVGHIELQLVHLPPCPYSLTLPTAFILTRVYVRKVPTPSTCTSQPLPLHFLNFRGPRGTLGI